MFLSNRQNKAQAIIKDYHFSLRSISETEFQVIEPKLKQTRNEFTFHLASLL